MLIVASQSDVETNVLVLVWVIHLLHAPASIGLFNASNVLRLTAVVAVARVGVGFMIFLFDGWIYLLNLLAERKFVLGFKLRTDTVFVKLIYGKIGSSRVSGGFETFHLES